MKISTSTTEEDVSFLEFLKSLDYKKKKMYHLLPDEKKLLVQSFPKNKQKKRALVIFSHEQHGINARNKWVNGLNHMRKQAKDANHFFNLIFELDREAVDDFIDIYLDFEAGEHDSEKNTDPSVYSALKAGVESFKARRYHEMDYDGLLDYFEANPHKNPLNKKKKVPTMPLDAIQPLDAKEMVFEGESKSSDPSSLMLNHMGKHLKERRIAKNITQSQLADLCQISERTVKKIEAGEPSSTKTLLKIFHYFDISKKVLEATKPELGETASTKRRVRSRIKVG